MLMCSDRAALRNRNLKVGKKLQQQCFELMIGAVDLIDQQQRAVRLSAKRFEHRPRDQEIVLIDVHILIARLTNRQHLARVVPLIKRRRRVDPFVTLQTHQLSREHRRDRFRRLGLADARRSFQQQRFAQREREISCRR